ncbi:MAG: glycosyltransferase [Muribaculaceae bacterium]|nr:glycosyltransferase [Muribaculaceae bacterium]
MKPMSLPISVCIIAKNEEKHLEECLKRLKPYHYEIVLVDTGSTDKTLDIATNYTDNIFHFDWINDFSAARNFALSKASNDWILSIDCDEYLESIEEDKLRLCMDRHPRSLGRILIRSRFREQGLTSLENSRVSRFFNRNYYCFYGAIHEQLVPKENFSSDTYAAPITVLHVGYDGSEEEMRAKSLRNLSLLEKELAAKGPDAYLYCQLGQSCRKLQDYEKAYEWFQLGLAMDVDPSQDYVRTMVESYGYCLLDLKRPKEALNLQGVYDVFSDRADFVFLMGLIYMNNGLFAEAIAEFEKSTTIKQFSVEGVNSYRANYNIGVIYECTNHPEEARTYYKKCGDFEPAKARLHFLSRH